MLAPGFEMCEKVGGTEFQLYLCATGIFNSIEILSADPKYKLGNIREDPFSLCHQQPYRYREACYTNMLPALLQTTQFDFLQTARVIEDSIKNDEDFKIRDMVISSLFHEYARTTLETEDYKESVQLCRSLKESSRPPCIDGLGGGHMKYGEPEKEYVKGLEFCGSAALFEDEKQVCFQHILSRLRIWYTQEKSRQICQTVDQKYRDFCRY